MCDSRLKGDKMVGEPEKYEFKKGKIKSRIFSHNVFVCI